MIITKQEESYLYKIDPEAAAATMAIRRYMDVRPAQATELMADYSALPTDKTNEWTQIKLL